MVWRGMANMALHSRALQALVKPDKEDSAHLIQPARPG